MPPALWRVRGSELTVGVASAALLLVLFAAPWYRVSPRLGGIGLAQLVFRGVYLDRTGWESLSILGPLALVVGIVGLAVLALQAICHAPAVPVCTTAIEGVLSLALTLGLFIRAFISRPSPPAISVIHLRADSTYGAYIAFVLALLVLAGCYRSLRTDGIAPADGPQVIEVIDLDELIAAGSRAPEA